MGYYVIAIGGTGNKILESIVYGACADIFYTLDGHGRHVPLAELRLMSVDVDAACGNTTRAQRAAEFYEETRTNLSGSAHRLFHTKLSLTRWNMNLSKRATSVKQMAAGSEEDKLLARALFDRAEAALEYSEGFRGHPDLGVLFFADLLNSLETRVLSGQPDELAAMLAQMRQELDLGESVKLILCGSIFGGTGASGLPALSKYVRKRFFQDSERFELGAMLMLPYYQVPVSKPSEEQEIVVKSSSFLDKARTALQYYGMEGLIRDGENDENGVFDAVYLLGLPPESFVTTKLYSTGSQSQENDAHMLEWLAARCAASFFRTGFRGENGRNIDCYYYQWHTRAFCWQSFDTEAELYRAGYGTLLKAAIVFFTECYPTLRAYIGSGRGHAERIGYCAPFFYKVGRYGAAQRSRLEKSLESLYRFFAFYANWMLQVLHTLPPDMRRYGRLGEAIPDALMETDDIPQNELFRSELMDALYRLLTQYGLPSDRRDYAAIARDSLTLQKGLAKVVVQKVPDRRDFRRVIAGLGSCKCDASTPETAFAGFLSALTQVVSEDDAL